MNHSEVASMSGVLDAAINHLLEIKKDNLFSEVSILAPNVLICQNINGKLLKAGIPVVNVFIETPKQHFLRKTEKETLKRGGVLSDRDILGLYSDILNKNELAYFANASDFQSYPHIFKNTIEELRLNATISEIRKFLNSTGDERISDIAKIADLYIEAKGDRVDYPDIVGLYSRSESDYIIMFPELLNYLSSNEVTALGKVETIAPQNCEKLPQKIIYSALSPTYEIREVLRKIIKGKLQLDQTLVIMPSDYLPLFEIEAHEAGVPIRSSINKALSMKEGAQLLNLIDILLSDYEYRHLKEFFALKGNFSPINALCACKNVSGFDVWIKKCDELKKDPKSKISSEIFDKLIEVLKKIKQLSDNKDTSASFLEDLPLLFKTLELSQNNKHIAVAQQIVQDTLQETGNEKLYAIQTLLRHKLESITVPLDQPPKDRAALTLTNELIAGAYHTVFSLGLTERQYPKSYKENPILRNEEIEVFNKFCNGNVKTSKAMNIDEKDWLQRMQSNAIKQWIGFFPAMDLISGRSESPSPYLELTEDNPPSRVSISPDQTSDVISDMEWISANLENNNKREKFISFYAMNSSYVKKHIETEQMKWDTCNQNLLGDLSTVQSNFTQRIFSASQFQKIISCPYSWLLDKVYKIKTLDEPGEGYSISASDKGTIIHAVLEKYIHRLLEGEMPYGQRKEWLYSEVEAQFADTAENCGRFADLLLQNDLQSMKNAVDLFIEYSQTTFIDGRFPVAAELSFGYTHTETSYSDPLKLDFGNGLLFSLSGSIDRVDRDKNGNAWIVDYKISSKKSYAPKAKESTVDGVKYLQPLLYSAALKLLPEGKGVCNIYAGFLPLKENSQEFMIEFDAQAATLLSDMTVFIAEVLNKRWFYTNTEEIVGRDPCTFCDYKDICGKMKSFIADQQRKKGESQVKLANIANTFEELRSNALLNAVKDEK